MKKLCEIPYEESKPLEINDPRWVQTITAPGLVPGGVYLLAGPPGAGKTTAAAQVAIGAATAGYDVLFVATEQRAETIASYFRRIAVTADALGGLGRIRIDDSINDIAELPAFLKGAALGADTATNLKLVVVDSIQGRGLSAVATKTYSALFEFTADARRRGLVVLLLAHVTKRGSIAGPKALEHDVDCVITMRNAFGLRPVFVSKNRFGATHPEPTVLAVDESGALFESKLQTAQAAVAAGLTGLGLERAECQTAVSIPKFGQSARLNAPFLPSKKIQQILSVLSQIDGVDLSDLSYDVNCLMPQRHQYRGELDLALAVSMLASYARLPVPADALFVGELDLAAQIREPSDACKQMLVEALRDTRNHDLQRVFLSERCAQLIREELRNVSDPSPRPTTCIVGVQNLVEVVAKLWPGIVGPLGREATASGPEREKNEAA
ncbi:MAG: AAA family ATPase [Deltaproteobacteria bacterium]|nr:AAA family ATPase [Deltaproteobacteria bacterium]